MDNEFIIFRRDSCPVIPGSFFLFRFRVSATVSKGISCCSFSVKTDTSVFLISESFSDSTGVFSNSAKTGSVSDFVFCSSSSSGGHNLTATNLNHSTRPDTSGVFVITHPDPHEM